MSSIIPLTAARVCRKCSSLVTASETCPLCAGSTEPHPERDGPGHYCMECAAGPFPPAQIHVVTWEEDAYMQTDEGDLITVCLPCHQQMEADNAAPL